MERKIDQIASLLQTSCGQNISKLELPDASILAGSLIRYTSAEDVRIESSHSLTMKFFDILKISVMEQSFEEISWTNANC